MRKQRHQRYTHCPVERGLDLISGKWKAVILFRVLEQKRRFNELRRLLPSVSQRVLTNQLREMEGDGLITRTVYAEVPPKVEYSVTELGRSLEPVLSALMTWAMSNFPTDSTSGGAKGPTRGSSTGMKRGTSRHNGRG